MALSTTSCQLRYCWVSRKRPFFSTPRVDEAVLPPQCAARYPHTTAAPSAVLLHHLT
jgi:hypothetical protein